MLQLVGRSGDHVALHTEYLIQLGVVAELIEDHGWDLSTLAFEQNEWDLLGYCDDRVCLAVEAKARPWRPDGDSLEALCDSLLARSTNPDVRVPANHDRKWRALGTFVGAGPVAVLLVASGARWWFDAQHRDGGLTITAAV